METIFEKCDEFNIDMNVIGKAADILRAGGLVGFPTETVYGLGGNALDATASGKIYAAKGRPSDNPLIVHISKVEDLYELSSDVGADALKLADTFWPGPLTMILKKKECVPYSITGGLETVAIRMPKNEIALALIRESGIYVAAPSANLSGRPSPTSAKHVLDDLGGRIDMIIDGGAVNVGIESTIVDLSEDVPTILRPGYITRSEIEACLGACEIDKAIQGTVKSELAPKAPGMKYKHYAPKGELTLVSGESKKVIERINELVSEAVNDGKKVAVMVSEEHMACVTCDIKRSLGADASFAAHFLYGYLREFDDLLVDCIYSESFDDDSVGQAVMNRMIKAAGHKIIKV